MQPSLKQMSKEVSQFTLRYKQAKIQVMMFQANQNEEQRSLYLHNMKFIEAFHYVLQHLIEESRQIIINDFINMNDHQWWLNFYARSTYYRIKNKALKELLSYFK